MFCVTVPRLCGESSIAFVDGWRHTLQQILPWRSGRSAPCPGENIPSNITRLTHFGERASWSPDGKRIAFMEKNSREAEKEGTAPFPPGTRKSG